MLQFSNGAFITSIIISVISLFVSIVSLVVPIYRDNNFIKVAMKGNDIATLGLAVPLLIISLILAKNNSKNGVLLWYGALFYMVYNYLFYLYGTAFNKMFLLYILIIVLSMYSLFFGLTSIDPNQYITTVPDSLLVKISAGFMILFAILLGSIWIIMSISYVFTEKIPQPIIDTEHPTAVVFATDLVVLIPLIAMSGIFLWKRTQWGYIFSTISLVKATSYGLALIFMTLLFKKETGKSDPLLFLWVILTLGSLFAMIVLLSLKSEKVAQLE